MVRLFFLAGMGSSPGGKVNPVLRGSSLPSFHTPLEKEQGNVASRIVAVHRTRLLQIVTEAEALAGTIRQISDIAKEILESKGGQLHVETKVSFCVGAYARLLKDLGVIEQLQSEGVSQKKPGYNPTTSPLIIVNGRT